MAPPGTKVVSHEKVDNRKLWAGHCTEVWYIGPSIQHYMYFNYYMPESFGERDSNIVECSPTTIPFLKVITDYYLRQEATDLLDTLREPLQSIPSLQYGL